ncbi:MAG: TolC family protein, partial [bacterium]
MKYFFLLFTIFFSFYSTSIKAEALTLKQIVNTAMLSSPVIRNIQGNIEVAEEAEKLVSSYHYPVINFTQSLMRSDNPVNVFAFKLGQEQFTMNDFDINALNNPNPRTNNQSSFTLFLPIYAGGEISRKHSAVSKQLESAEYQKAWAKKIVRRNIYTLYYAIVN